MERSRKSTRPGRDFDEGTQGLDRRQLLRAGVWAAPVIMLATATPAAAASAPSARATVAMVNFSDHGITTVWQSDGEQFAAMSGQMIFQNQTSWEHGEVIVTSATLMLIMDRTGIDTSKDPEITKGSQHWHFLEKALGEKTVSYSFLYTDPSGVARFAQSQDFQYRIAGDLSRAALAFPKVVSGILFGEQIADANAAVTFRYYG